MPAGWKVDFNIAGFNQIRNDPRIVAELLLRGERIARACGSGYRAQISSGKTRGRVTVWPDTVEARIDETQHNNLIRNLEVGRG